MKKYIVITIIIAVGMLSGLSALAATSVALTPAAVNVKAGQTFTVTVTVDPQGVKNYTVELKLNFPADLLQVQSFPFNDQWMALSQAGYYLTDNACSPKCGDGIKTNEETSDNCCKDAGCSTGYKCEQNRCVELLPKLDAAFSQSEIKLLNLINLLENSLNSSILSF